MEFSSKQLSWCNAERSANSERADHLRVPSFLFTPFPSQVSTLADAEVAEGRKTNLDHHLLPKLPPRWAGPCSPKTISERACVPMNSTVDGREGRTVARGSRLGSAGIACRDAANFGLCAKLGGPSPQNGNRSPCLSAFVDSLMGEQLGLVRRSRGPLARTLGLISVHQK